MVNLAPLIGIVVFVLVAVVAFKIIKSVIKTIILLFAITTLITGLFAALLVVDALDFKDRMADGKKTLLVTDEETVVGGVVMVDSPILFSSDKREA